MDILKELGDLFGNFTEEVTSKVSGNSNIKTVVEVFKGTLTTNAVLEAVKKEFASDKSLLEGVLLGNLKKCDPKFASIISSSFVDIVVSPDFAICYLILVNNKGVVKIMAIVTESVEDKLQKMFDDHKQIVRIKK